MVRASSFAMVVGLGASLLMSTPSTALGQSLTIVGRVVNAADLKPIVAATVNMHGDLTTVAVTDSAGRYSMAIPRPDVTLVFSALGYAVQETSPQGRTVVNVTLMPRPLLLEDLVVTGYGQQSRATISGRVDRSEDSRALGTLPCEGAALLSPPGLDPHTPPLQMPAPDHPSSPIPNACAAPNPGSAATR